MMICVMIMLEVNGYVNVFSDISSDDCFDEMDGNAEIPNDNIGDGDQIRDSNEYDVVYISSNKDCTTVAIPDEIVMEGTFVMAFTRKSRVIMAALQQQR